MARGAGVEPDDDPTRHVELTINVTPDQRADDEEHRAEGTHDEKEHEDPVFWTEDEDGS